MSINESENKPHRCSSGFYVRSGASLKKLSRDEVRSFMEKEELIEFSSLTCKKFTYEKHFDKNKLFYFLDRVNIKYSKKNYVQLLENLEVAKKQGSKVIFNNAGALFFAKNLENIFPHAGVSCALFKGTEKIHVIDRKIFNKDIINNVEESVAFLKKNLRLEYSLPKGKLRREELLEIPEEALREALINAVTHRNYLDKRVSTTVEIFDDRVEIYNSGALPKNMKKADLGKRSIPRNPLIAELMLRAKYIEKMGTGINKMRSLVRKAGLKPIKFKFTELFTTLTFYRKPLSTDNVGTNGDNVGTNGDNVGTNGDNVGTNGDNVGTNGDNVGTNGDNVGTNGDNVGTNFSVNFGIRKVRNSRLVKMLVSIEKGSFSVDTFANNSSSIDTLAKDFGITVRTLERDLKFLKEMGLIYFEGATKTGRYKVTEKYKKLKR